jgi:hypothetical protein
MKIFRRVAGFLDSAKEWIKEEGRKKSRRNKEIRVEPKVSLLHILAVMIITLMLLAVMWPILLLDNK